VVLILKGDGYLDSIACELSAAQVITDNSKVLNVSEEFMVSFVKHLSLVSMMLLFVGVRINQIYFIR